MLAGAIVIGVVIVEVAQKPLPLTPVVLGSKGYFAPSGVGWGSPHPVRIFNGGDPSGDIFDVHWSSWGGEVAIGWGANPVFKPEGGYYRHAVKIELRASGIRRCTPDGPLSYTRLMVREPSRPGGPIGRWEPWATNMCIDCSAAPTQAFRLPPRSGHELSRIRVYAARHVSC